MSVEPIVRQVIDLNMRYYKALGLATLEYVQGLASFWSRNVRRAAPASSPFTPAPPSSGATVARESPAPSVVLEAAAGERAAAVFAVANHLTRPVSATFDISPFRDERGRDAGVTIEIEPASVALDPGQQAVVRITAAISEELQAAVAYSGSVNVPGLADRPIPIVIRRVASAAPAKPRRRKRKAPAPARARRR